MHSSLKAKIDTFRSWFGWTYPVEGEFLRFKALVGTLPPLAHGSPNAVIVTQLLAKAPQDVTWDDIGAGRLALVPVMSIEALQAAFVSLSDEYEAVTGEKPFADSAFPNPPKTVDAWRAGVVCLIEDLAKFRRVKLMFERMRSVVGMLFGFPLIAAVLFGFWHSIQPEHHPPLWQSVVFAGFIGAGFSVLTRLYSLSWSTRLASQIEDAQAFKKGLVINCILSLAEGLIASCVIYCLFASGLIKGTLFPEFKSSRMTLESPFWSLINLEPQDTIETAKLLLWAFIAGFAERLVPDKLNQLAGTVGKEEE